MGKIDTNEREGKVGRTARSLFREADIALGSGPSRARHERNVESDDPRDREALNSVWIAIAAKQFETEAGLYEENRGFYWTYVDLADERYYDALASATLLAHRYEDFETVPYLFALGPPNSGKSRLLECLQALCPRPILTSSISPAALYQVMHTWRPTLLIDETELYRTEGEAATEVRAILNSGYRRGQYAIRGSKDGKKPKMYTVFGFKALAGTDPLYETTMQRCIVIPMEKARRDLPLAIDKHEAMKIRAQLEYYCFHHNGNQIDADQTRKEIGDARVTELFLPLLSVTPTVEARERLLSLAKDIAGDRLAEEQSGVEAEILKAILGCENKVENGKLSTKDISEAYNCELPDKEHVRSDWIGRKLQRLGLKRTRFGHGGARAILWDQSHIERLKRRYLPDLALAASAVVPLVPTQADDTSKLTQGTTADTLQAYMSDERHQNSLETSSHSQVLVAGNTGSVQTLEEKRAAVIDAIRSLQDRRTYAPIALIECAVRDKLTAHELGTILPALARDGLVMEVKPDCWRLTRP